jgi:hypothetical protein
MSYYEGVEEDAARDAFYEQISAELYPEHKDRAIFDFTAERLCSYYVKHPDVMRPAVNALQEGKALLSHGHHSAAIVFFASTVELLLKATLLQPVVHGLVHHPGLADVVVDQALGQSGFERYQKLMASLFSELARIDVKLISRPGTTKPLLTECSDVQKLRNDVIHKGASCDAEAAECAMTVAVATYERIVCQMLEALGLFVGDQGIIHTRW